MFVLKSLLNSFHYLYQDAEYFHGDARQPDKGFGAVRASRTAVLLYIMSLEALINRALEHFLPERVRQFVVDREEKFSLEDKWQLLPLLATVDGQFDRSAYPWSHFVELIRIRNDFAHPKHDRAAYYEAHSVTSWSPLSWKETPEGMAVKETDVIYRQSQIPRDPYAIRPKHADAVKRIVDDTITELDRLLGGKLTSENWYRSDSMKVVWPAGAQIADLPVAQD